MLLFFWDIDKILWKSFRSANFWKCSWSIKKKKLISLKINVAMKIMFYKFQCAINYWTFWCIDISNKNTETPTRVIQNITELYNLFGINLISDVIIDNKLPDFLLEVPLPLGRKSSWPDKIWQQVWANTGRISPAFEG